MKSVRASLEQYISRIAPIWHSERDGDLQMVNSIYRASVWQYAKLGLSLSILKTHFEFQFFQIDLEIRR